MTRFYDTLHFTLERGSDLRPGIWATYILLQGLFQR